MITKDCTSYLSIVKLRNPIQFFIMWKSNDTQINTAECLLSPAINIVPLVIFDIYFQVLSNLKALSSIFYLFDYCIERHNDSSNPSFYILFWKND